MSKKDDAARRDKVLKHLMDKPPESAKDLARRKRIEKYAKGDEKAPKKRG